MLRLHKPIWLMLFLMLWLPVQGFAAPFMPFCQHSHSQADAAMPCHIDHGSDKDAMTARCAIFAVCLPRLFTCHGKKFQRPMYSRPFSANRSVRTFPRIPAGPLEAFLSDSECRSA
jgi:hypothetical protein